MTETLITLAKQLEELKTVDFDPTASAALLKWFQEGGLESIKSGVIETLGGVPAPATELQSTYAFLSNNVAVPQQRTVVMKTNVVNNEAVSTFAFMEEIKDMVALVSSQLTEWRRLGTIQEKTPHVNGTIEQSQSDYVRVYIFTRTGEQVGTAYFDFINVEADDLVAGLKDDPTVAFYTSGP